MMSKGKGRAVAVSRVMRRHNPAWQLRPGFSLKAEIRKPTPLAPLGVKRAPPCDGRLRVWFTNAVTLQLIRTIMLALNCPEGAPGGRVPLGFRQTNRIWGSYPLVGV